jgi:hypothetical protein
MDYKLVLVRLLAFVSAAAALALPSPAFPQQDTLNGSIAGLTLPLRLNTTVGPTVTHLTPGVYAFSLLDNSGQHSFHVRGPFDRAAGLPSLPVNFGTAGPDGSDVRFASTSPLEWSNVPLQDGLYRWFCDLHGDLMRGSVAVGNYLAVEVESGRGTIASPAGIACERKCGLGLPNGSPPVTLTATPAAGYEFQGWSSGPCSGPGPCTVSVNGLVEVRAVFRRLATTPPPPEAAPAALTAVRVGRTPRARVVTLRLNVNAQTHTVAQLRRGARVLTSARATLAPGARTIKLRVPRSAAAGRATVRLSLRGAGSSRTFAVTRAVRLPRA